MNMSASTSTKALMAACIFVLGAAFAQAQDSTVIRPKIATYQFDAIPKDPLASAAFSATIPGSGQIYNKEYLRGAVTAAGFYSGAYVFRVMIQKWETINSDTFYIREAFDTTRVHRVITAKPSGELVGLAKEDKAVLALSMVATAGFYVWGIIDSYTGANRYNKKLLASAPSSLQLCMAANGRDFLLELKAPLRLRS